MGSHDFTEITSGLRFPEGPVVMPDGSIVLVEINGGRVTRVDPATGTKTVIAEGLKGPNGLALGPDGMLYLCTNGGFGWIEEGGTLMPHETAPDYAGGSIQRVDPVTGTVETLYTHAAKSSCAGRTTSCSMRRAASGSPISARSGGATRM